MLAVKELRGIIKEKADSGDDLAKGVQDTLGKNLISCWWGSSVPENMKLTGPMNSWRVNSFVKGFLFYNCYHRNAARPETLLLVLLSWRLCALQAGLPWTLWKLDSRGCPQHHWGRLPQGSCPAEINTAVWCCSSTLRTGIMRRSLLMRWFFSMIVGWTGSKVVYWLVSFSLFNFLLY